MSSSATLVRPAALPWLGLRLTDVRVFTRSEEHTSELQSRQYLHSFPTRRSSDLRSRVRSSASGRRPAEVRAASIRDADQGSPSMIRGRGERRIAPCPPPPPSFAPRPCRGSASASPTSASSRDRKSTRLNSSHANIYTLSLHDALPI